jgi:predicted nucleic acid-binding protein
MVTGLLDTSILIDLLRYFPPALTWMQTQTNLGVTQIVWLEVLNGATNRIKQRQAVKLLSDFTKIDLIAADLDWAIEQSVRYKLSHNIGMMDGMIAAVSMRLNVPIYTMNIKHFGVIVGNLAQKPY